MMGVGNWPCWVSFGFYIAVASISGWYFFIMYDDIAGLKPGTRWDSTQQLLVSVVGTSSSCMMILQALNQVQGGILRSS